MAKVIKSTPIFRQKIKKKRPGIHSKTKSSSNKNSTNYKKVYVGQGK